jgi:hypothetical protein
MFQAPDDGRMHPFALLLRIPRVIGFEGAPLKPRWNHRKPFGKNASLDTLAPAIAQAFVAGAPPSRSAAQ